MRHPDHKIAAGLWLFLLLMMSVWISVRMTSGNIIDSDILNLLPRTQYQDVPREALDNLYQEHSRKLVVVIVHPELEIALRAARQLQALAEPYMVRAFGNDEEPIDRLKSVASLYQPYSRNLVTDHDYQVLLDRDYQRLISQAKQTLYSPLTAVNSDLLASDPLFSFSRFVQGIQGDIKLHWSDGWPYLLVGQSYHVIYPANLEQSPFNLDLQDQLIPLIADWRDSWKSQHDNGDLFFTGTLFYAHHGVRSAKQEISTVGAGSLAGIVLLFLLSFRGLKPLIMMIITISAGILSGFTTVLLLFPQIHIMALVFGATLLGISIDYSFHFFAKYYYSKWPQSGDKVVAEIRVALLLGLATSAAAYLSLLLGDFPGLHQIALFSAAGLAASCLTVILLYPIIWSGPTSDNLKPADSLRPLLTTLTAPINNTCRWLISTGLIILAAIGISRLAPDDDVRLLQPVSPQLKAQQNRIEGLLSEGQANQYFVVRAASLQLLLEKEETLREHLHTLKQQNSLADEQMLSEFLPSARRQQQTRRLLDDFYQSDAARDYFIATGIPHPGRDPGKTDVLDQKAFSASPLASQIGRFLLTEGDDYVSVVLLKQIRDLVALEALADPANGIFWIDRTGDINQVFKNYRAKASQLLLYTVGLILLILVLRYGLSRGLLATGVPLLACACVLGILGFTAAPFNLFHLLGLMVVLGLGLDYAIFLSEYHRQQQATLIAISLSVVTTLLAFGLLGLSSTPAVSSFGMVIAAGVSITFVLSILLLTTTAPGIVKGQIE